MQIFHNNKLNERPEWDEMQRSLSAYLSETELQRFGETQGDSLDFVELVMALEEKYGKRLFCRGKVDRAQGAA